ncbi:MAG: adenylate kinase family protein [Candidatus Aenigmarchaeota archaeon]|nr:adenylate kinase family protein [Candidatus Aenigmarchaeota archaeon]
MIIIITGTPATGKTRISNELAKALDRKTGKKFKVLHINTEILRRGLWSSVDKKRKSKNVDMRKLNKFVSEQVKDNQDLIIESHLAHYFKGDVVFVLRANIGELRKRMENRGWNGGKIEENLEAERLNVILGEALDIHGKKCIEIDTYRKTPKSVARTMFRHVERLR